MPIDCISARKSRAAPRFRRCSDFTRLKIMYAIMKEEKSVSEIVEEVGASQSLVSHQLSVLKNADLVSTRKDGTKVFYRLADEHVDMLLKIVYEHVSEKE